jgi:hypothetical protein
MTSIGVVTMNIPPLWRIPSLREPEEKMGVMRQGSRVPRQR